MQRTVKTTRFTYCVNEIDEKGAIASRLETVEVMETNEKKALKEAFKKVGPFYPMKTETVESLYKMDDETFFKYAVKVEHESK